MAIDIKDELAAIETVMAALEPLPPESRASVVDFIFKKLGMSAPNAPPAALSRAPDFAPHLPSPPEAGHGSNPTDIRSFKEQKNPKTVNQMVALVAYYLEHLAPAFERREYITGDDIQPYFKQAGFRFPEASTAVTLSNAKNAGYLNALERGQFRLNPVGYNLVEHKLPMDKDPRGSSRSSKGKKGGTKRKAPKARK